jgi:type I restriction enzyme M protein
LPVNSANVAGGYFFGNGAFLSGLPASSITLTGDVTGAGNTGTPFATTLSATGVVPGTYGDDITVPQITVDAKGRITKKDLITALKDKTLEKEVIELLNQYKTLAEKEDGLKKTKKKLDEELTTKIIEKYKNLDEKVAKNLIIENKWMDAVSVVVYGQLDKLIQTFTKRLTELEERYKSPLPVIMKNREELNNRVHKHLEAMGMKW